LAHKVCLLIVQLHIDTKKPTEALKLITYIESQFVSTENATNILTGSTDQVGPIHTKTDKTEKVYTMII
jgi:CCR4-NOT transcription complex subunit 10